MVEKKTESSLDMKIFYKASGCPLSKVELDDPAHQALLDQALGTATISASAISDILLDQWGISIGKDTVLKHRNIPQRCSCKNIPKEFK